MSLADQIAKLTNPAPEIQDPEDDINVETAAKVCEKTDEDNELINQVSILRSRNAPLLDEIDQKYAGKRVKRRDLDDYIEPDVSDEEDENSNEQDDDDEAIESFKLKIQEKPMLDNRTVSDDENDESSDVDDDSLSKEDSGDGSSDDEDEDNDDGDDSEDSGDDMVQKFSSIDVSSEIEKGKAVETQQELWNRLCECRIKLQKLLIVANKLPQFYAWNTFKQNSDSAYTENVNKGYKTVRNLLNGFLDLQTELLVAEPELTSVMKGNTEGAEKNVDDDEEIPSEDEDMKDNVVTKDRKPRKRKLKEEEYDEFLTKRHKSLIPYRNSVIQKWDEKTRLSTGRMTQKSFSAFEQSALKQIEQILGDKNRLIKRTQLKRSIYRVLGKIEPEEKADAPNKPVERKSNEQMKDYDPEIFDDDDFYRQLLKDIIECKAVGIDPAILNKQQEIQKIRSKMKKQVDTKASKGRRIRYNPHTKLVNFMAPVVTCGMPDTARDELFRSLFGQCSMALNT